MSARAARLAVLALAVPLLGGCATMRYDAVSIGGLVAANRAAPAGSYEVIGQLEVERRAIFAIADLITLRDAELEEIVRKELARTAGDAVINLRIYEEYDAVDVLVSLLQGLIATRSYTVRGDVIRWKPPGG